MLARASGSLSARMRRLVFLAFLLLTPRLLAAPMTFFEGSLEVEVPAIFRALDDAAIDSMFAGARSKPAVVLATPDSETRISMTHADAPLGPEDLEDTRASLKARIDSQAKIAWLRDEMVTLNGSPWFRLDYDMDSGADIKREIILGTSLRGRLLFVVVATPVDDQELLNGDLQTLIDSLRLLHPVEN